MSAVVVGPSVITGPGAVDPELAATALQCLDDELALVDDRPVLVDELLRDVLAAAVGSARDVVLVHPSWWPAARVDRIAAAAPGGPGTVLARRSDVLASGSATVELSPDLIAVVAAGRRHLIARVPPATRVVEAIAARLGDVPDVTVDAPAGTAGFAAAVATRLRERGAVVTVTDDATLLDAARAASRRPRRIRPRAAAVTVAVAAAGALTAAAVGLDDGSAADVAWVVEDRVTLEVPAHWAVERITAGPGSVRVRVVSPRDRSAVLHVAQTRVRTGQTLDATAASLQTALAEEPDGVFVDFVAHGTRAGREAITYRELRAGGAVDWTVVLDGGVRIAVGCQGAGVGPACDRAVASARAVMPKVTPK